MPASRLADLITSDGVRAADHVSDVDEFVALASPPTRPHRIMPHARDGALDAQMHVLDGGAVSFTHLSYGGDVTVIPGDATPDTFLFCVTLAGHAHFRYGRDEVGLGSHDAAVIAPYREFRSEISGDHDQVIVTVKQDLVESIGRRYTSDNEPLHRRFTAAQRFQMSTSAITMLHSAALLAADPGAPAREHLFRRQVDVAVEAMVLSLPSFKDDSPTERLHSKRVSAAITFMQAHLDEPLALARIADAVGVSPRGLQRAFRRELGETPTEWLRSQRLSRAEELLRAADPAATTVTEVAMQCGFFHPGEFSVMFRARFGVSPSAVLQARASSIR